MVAMSDVDEETEFHLYSLIHHQSLSRITPQNDCILTDTNPALLNPKLIENKSELCANPFKRSFEQVIRRPRKSPPSNVQQKFISRRNCVNDIQPLLNNMPDYHWGISHDLRMNTFNHQSKCISCNKNGHKHFDCPYQQNRCYLCGEKNHKSTQHKFCSICLDDDHHSSKCFYKKRAQKACHICKSKGHWKEICLSKWRQYHMTTQSIYYNNTKYKSSEESQLDPLFCYNCGNKGHNGKICSAARMSRFVPHDPANIMYNKCPPPKPIIKDSHEPNLVFIEDKSGCITNTTFDHSSISPACNREITTCELYPRHEKSQFSLSLFPSNSLPCSLLYKGDAIVNLPLENAFVSAKPSNSVKQSSSPSLNAIKSKADATKKCINYIKNIENVTKSMVKTKTKLMPLAKIKTKEIQKEKNKAVKVKALHNTPKSNFRATLKGTSTLKYNDIQNDSGLGQEIMQRSKLRVDFSKATGHKFMPTKKNVLNIKQDRSNFLKAWRAGLEQKMLLGWE